MSRKRAIPKNAILEVPASLRIKWDSGIKCPTLWMSQRLGLKKVRISSDLLISAALMGDKGERFTKSACRNLSFTLKNLPDVSETTPGNKVERF